MSKAYIVSRTGGTVTKAPINDNKLPIYANETALDADLVNIGENVICMANGFFYLVKTVGGVKTKTQLTDKGYGLPLGTIIAYEGSVPDGFLACDGSAYNTTTYSALYALLGVNTTPNLTSQNMTNTDGWCIKATPAYVEPDTVSDMVHTMRVQDSYSTEEVNTGKTWIDGKPIYRKVFKFWENGNVASGYTISGQVFTKTSGNITDNAESIIKFEAVVRTAFAWCNQQWISGGTGIGVYWISDNQFYSNFGSTVINEWIIVEYTKATG